MSNTDLVSLGALNLVPANIEELESLSSSVEFFNRIQLMAPTSKLVQEGKIAQGEFALITGKDEFINLTKAFDAILLGVHAKALRITGDEVIASYDMNSELFKSIQEASAVPNSGNMFGLEFLLHLGGQDRYATYHLSNPTARREAKNFNSLLGKAASVSSKLIVTKKNRWFGPVCVPCSSYGFDVPPIEDIQANRDKFMNPKSSEKEPAKDGDVQER